MNVYIALLRGINVAGRNKIKMAELKQLFNNLGFQKVITYIQSGNLIFKTDIISSEEIAQKISNALFQHFKCDIPVLILEKEELKWAYNLNPFIQDEATDISKLYITFLESLPNKNRVIDLETKPLNTIDFFKISTKFVYLYCNNGYGKTKLNNRFFEKKLNTNATTRNWKTIAKLIELSKF